MQSNPLKVSDKNPESIEKNKMIFLELDKLELIKIEIRNNQIYGAITTEKAGYLNLDAFIFHIEKNILEMF